jgi:hypothetical protein
MKRLAGFALTAVALSFGGAWLIAILMPGAEIPRAVFTSAAIAVPVQLAAFALTRGMQPANVIAGWGAGMLVRFFALAVYALLVVKAMGLAYGPALLSFAGFLFVSTLVEPVFLKPDTQ